VGRLRAALAGATALLLLAAPAQGELVFTPQFTPLVPGLDRAHLRVPAVPCSIHILRLDRTNAELKLATSLAQGRVQGLATVADQARAARVPGLVPLAAINGGYFDMNASPYQGDPATLLIVEGELVSTPANTSFWMDGAQRMHLGVIFSQLEVTWPDGSRTPLRLNEPPDTNTVVLFTPIFGPTLPPTAGTALRLERAGSARWLPLRANRQYTARVQAIAYAGALPLEPDTGLLIVGPQVKLPAAAAQPGALLKISTTLTADLASARCGIGGGPTLLCGGQPNDWLLKPHPGEKAPDRQPRSAIGFNDRYFFMVVVDGRQRASAGLTYAELLELMRQLGCTDALNLDGGGSSTLWVQGQVVNSPSGLRLRPTADALVIRRRDR
jgi:hypothetical protein